MFLLLLHVLDVCVICVCSVSAHMSWCACGGSRAVLWSQVTLPHGFWGLKLDCQPCTASAFTPEPSCQSLEVNVYVLSMNTYGFCIGCPLLSSVSRTAKQILPTPPPGFILRLIPCDVSPPCECLCLYACLSSYHRLPLEAGHCLTML